MRKKNILIVVILLIILIGGVYAGKLLMGPSLKNFYVNQSDLVVEANNMQKVEVFALKEGSSEPVVLGTMEVVEQNDKNDQTWVLPISNQTGTTTKVYAQGTTKEGKLTRKFTLKYKTPEEIAKAFGRASTTQTVLYGTVNSVAGNILSLNIHATTTVRVTLAPGVQVFNKNGVKILPSQLVKGGLVSLTGRFTDETSFTANEVAEEETATTTPKKSGVMSVPKTIQVR